MIVLDMDMQNDCQGCPFRERSESNTKINYCIANQSKIIKVKDIEKERPDWCPIKDEVFHVRINDQNWYGELDNMSNPIETSGFDHYKNYKENKR